MTLTLMWFHQSSSASSMNGAAVEFTALLISMSTPPSSATVVATRFWMSSATPVSARTATTRRPVRARISAAASSRSSTPRAQMATSTPSCARAMRGGTPDALAAAGHYGDLAFQSEIHFLLLGC